MRLALVGCLLLISSAAYSQVTTPSVGDPEVFYRYLRRAHYEVENANSGVSNREASADRIHASTAALAALESAYQSVTAAIASIDAEVKAYVDGVVAQKQAPELAQLEKFYAKRLSAIRSVRLQLGATVAPNAWSKIEEYVDGEYRSSVRRTALPAPKLR